MVTDLDNGTVIYDGPLGHFVYDPLIWSLCEDKGDGFLHSEYYSLRYIGCETDGSRIRIPEGLISGYCMFEDCVYLLTPPVLPAGLKHANKMFKDCRFLKLPPDLPDTLESCYEMFSGCESLERAVIMPKSVYIFNHMYEGCPEDIRLQGEWFEGHRDIDVSYEVIAKLLERVR